jgi:hypothetical protein
LLRTCPFWISIWADLNHFVKLDRVMTHWCFCLFTEDQHFWF